MQITGRPSRLSSVHSHVVVGPVSMPIRTVPGAFDLTNEAIVSGSESTTPSYKGMVLRRYRTNACQRCPIKHNCTISKERLISRWEHERVLEAVQRRLDEHPEKMRQRREMVEHPFGTLKLRMGATHFLMKTLPRVAAEMALHVLAYNLTRVMNIMGIRPLMAAMRA
jgi:Transposase DDE domain